MGKVLVRSVLPLTLFVLGRAPAMAAPAVVVLWLVWKNKRVVHLLPSEPDKRLGAPHGASQSRPVNYCMQDSRGPNSIGRRQMRQHMRDVS